LLDSLLQEMPKSKGKSKNGSSKKIKNSEPCNLNRLLIEQVHKYEHIFSRSDNFEDANLSLTSDPFTTCKINNVLESGFLQLLRDEVCDMDFVEKNNDLYKFHQSGELNECELPHVRSLRTMLIKTLKPIISKMVGAELDDRLALFCGRYGRTDYLLCHDDELEGRRIAFILYLVPAWKEEDGGNLELFETDKNGNPGCVSRRLVPSDNSLVFFEVSPVSFHQVSEVLADKTRLSLGGWFHGTSLPRAQRALIPAQPGQTHQDISEDLFFSLLNPIYLNPETQAEIQEKFEESSEISLPQFFSLDKFEKAAEQLRSIADWDKDFTPNRRNFECLPSSNWSGPVGDLALLMSSEPFFLLLSNLTGLKLHALAPADSDGEEVESEENGDVSSPTCKGRIRKLTQGSYSLIRDDDLGQAEFALDARICLNVNGWRLEMGGQMVYIARGEDEELVTVQPENNSLNLVYRDKESLRFLKYVNSSVEDENCGPWHDLDFTYYE